MYVIKYDVFSKITYQKKQNFFQKIFKKQNEIEEKNIYLHSFYVIYLHSFYVLQNENEIFENYLNKLNQRFNAIKKIFEEKNDIYFLNKTIDFFNSSYTYILINKDIYFKQMEEIKIENIITEEAWKILTIEDFILMCKYFINKK